MHLESSHQEYESEISEVIFDETFEENYHDNSEIDRFDNIFHDDNDNTDLELQIESLATEIDGLNSEDAYNYIAEVWPALIPLITALAPTVIQAATKLAPKAIKAVSGMVGSRSKPRQKQSVRRYPAQKTSKQRTLHQPSNCRCNTKGGSIAKLGRGALDTLSNLLNNKGVQSILSGLANKGISQALKLGNSETLAREGALLNAIEYLAHEAQYEALDDQFDDAMEYLIGQDGDYVADPDSSESRALRFIDLFNN